MKRNSFFLMIIVSLSVVTILSACKPKKFNLSSADTKINLSDEQQTKTVVVNGSDGNCEISYSPEWIKTSVSDSTVTINVSPNSDTQNRSDSIVVKCGPSHLTFLVTQGHKATRLEVKGKNNVSFTKEGGTKEVELDTDGSVKVEAFDGVTATFEDGNLKITAQPNKSDSPIDGVVKLKAGNLSEEIKVHINGAICQTCKGKGKIICRNCNGAGESLGGGGIGGRQVVGCRACGGSGFRFVFDDTGVRRGSGKQTCPTCKGTGK